MVKKEFVSELPAFARCLGVTALLIAATQACGTGGVEIINYTISYQSAATSALVQYTDWLGDSVDDYALVSVQANRLFTDSPIAGQLLPNDPNYGWTATYCRFDGVKDEQISFTVDSNISITPNVQPQIVACPPAMDNFFALPTSFFVNIFAGHPDLIDTEILAEKAFSATVVSSYTGTEYEWQTTFYDNNGVALTQPKSQYTSAYDGSYTP